MKITLAGICLVLLISYAAAAGPSTGFEQGLGHDQQPIYSSVPGFYFDTYTGAGFMSYDITSGSYSARSDNGLSYEDGDYFVHGNVAAGIADLSNTAYIMLDAPADNFSVYYCSRYDFYVDVWNETELVTTLVGSANTKSKGGTSMNLLSISAPDIIGVEFRGQGGYWLIDDVVTAPVPEPASILLLAIGSAGVLGRMRRRR